MAYVFLFLDRYVILGGHRDAWVFGGIDPMSGAAVTHETVRSAGRLLSKGEKMLAQHIPVYLIYVKQEYH